MHAHGTDRFCTRTHLAPCPASVHACRPYPAGMHVLIKGFVTNMPELMSASGADWRC